MGFLEKKQRLWKLSPKSARRAKHVGADCRVKPLGSSPQPTWHPLPFLFPPVHVTRYDDVAEQDETIK
ncbi:hypothetical protein NC653_038416 [Populus alba x Populus x berolinensis]|uniref:Uncharacterized protein n=1 Tax=Populus alba x Populus x berolinensis TaxID=444605 RepID=A0AAD6LGS2_9ROSI|nr:hypothetical protein NC653_038416 [Populus alba x Populus x berolinensis]